MTKITKEYAEAMYEKILKKIESKHGNGTTTNHQLDRIGKGLFGKKYIGTFPSDKIPVLQPGTYCIANLDNSSQKGSHWIAIIKVNKKTSVVYDSFGRKTYKIIPSLLQSGNGVILETENDREQDLNGKVEDNCGQRCMASIKVYEKLGMKGLMHI